MTRPALLWWGIGAILAAMALGASLTAVGTDVPPAIDTGWNAVMVSIRSEFLVGLADLFNHIGGGWIATYLIPMIIIAAMLLVRRWQAAILVVVTLLVSVGAVQLLKSLYGRGRPDGMLVTSDFGSFPSGHTANAATLAVLAVLLVPRLWVVVTVVLWTLAMALSRTMLSVHWLSDTIGGMLVGAGAALIVGSIMVVWARNAPTRPISEEPA